MRIAIMNFMKLGKNIKYYLWGMLIVMGNIYASDVIWHTQRSLMQELQIFECFKSHWHSGAKGFPVLERKFDKDFNFARRFTYGEITGTLLQIAAKLNDQNGIRSLFYCPGGIRDRKDILKNMEYIEQTFKGYALLDMQKFLAGPGFFDLLITEDEDLYYKRHTLRAFYDKENDKYYFEYVPLEEKYWRR